MTQTEYEQKRTKCWEEFKRQNLDGEVQWQLVSRYDAFCAAFDRAYTIGKQEKDAEGEEMLTVSAITVREMYAANERIKTDTPDKELGRTSDHINHVLRCLFGSKCLPDEGTDCIPVEVAVAENTTTGNVDSPEANIDSLDGNVESVEPKNSRCEKCGAPNSSICAHMNCQDYIPRTELKPAELKFKVGQLAMFKGRRKVEIIGYSDHTPKLYRVFVLTENYHITAHESDLEPYTEPEKESRNLSKNIANCDKCPKSVQKKHPVFGHSMVKDEMIDSIIKEGFSKERRLNIAAQFMSAMMSNPAIFHLHLNAEEEDYILYGSLEFADALINEAEKGGPDVRDKS